MEIEINLNNYFENLTRYKETNEDYLIYLKESYTSFDDANLKNKLHSNSTALFNNLTHILEHSKDILLSPSIIAEKRISEHFSSLEKMLSELERFHSQLLNKNRSFKDIVLNGPESMAEVTLMESATQFLEPNELDGAMRNDSPVSTVLGKIEDSKNFKMNKEFTIAHQQRVNQMQQEKAEKQENIKQEVVNSLGTEGILSTLGSNMTFAEKVKAPDNSPNQTEKTLGIDI